LTDLSPKFHRGSNVQHSDTLFDIRRLCSLYCGRFELQRSPDFWKCTARRYDHTTQLLCELHWLKVPELVRFRLCVLTYRCLNSTVPHYLAETIRPVSSRGTHQNFRSAETSTLLVPSTRRSTLGDRSFPVAGARAWNALPQHVRNAPSLSVFRRERKIILFRLSFPDVI